MKEIHLDFSQIGDYEDFYEHLNQRLENAEIINDFDQISNFLKERKIHLEFINMSVDQLDTFEELLGFFEEKEEIADGFSFRYFLEQFED